VSADAAAAGGHARWLERGFTWRDGERLIGFATGSAGQAAQLLAREGLSPFVLLASVRAAAAVPALAAAAAAVVPVAHGQVPDVALAAEGDLPSEPLPLVALGGGRVIDAAKALAAARDLPCAAVPTTLSGAELTAIHRPLADGRGARPLRPQVVVTDPELLTQPPADLVASAMNAMGHAMEAVYVSGAGPVSTAAAVDAAGLLAGGAQGLGGEEGGERVALALGGLLAGYAIGATGLGLHHVLCQSVVRVSGAPHASVNAVMLPHTLRFMLPRAGAELAPVVRALVGLHDPALALELVTSLVARSGTTRLRQLGVDAAELEEAAALAARRPELRATPSAPAARGLLGLLERGF
jgi:alcohol dehydrogenase class IV